MHRVRGGHAALGEAHAVALRGAGQAVKPPFRAAVRGSGHRVQHFLHPGERPGRVRPLPGGRIFTRIIWDSSVKVCPSFLFNCMIYSG